MENSESKKEEKFEMYKRALSLTFEVLDALNNKSATEVDRRVNEERARNWASQIELDGIRLGAVGGGHEKLVAQEGESGEIYFRIFDNGMDPEYIQILESLLERKFTENGLIFRKSSA